jgi:hypothetical protein
VVRVGTSKGSTISLWLIVLPLATGALQKEEEEEEEAPSFGKDLPTFRKI